MIRALPILIIFMVMMIGSKILDILEIAPDYFSVHIIKAVEEKKPENSKESTKEKEVASEKKNVDSDKPPENQANKDNALLMKFSVTEIEMLQELAKRREELDLREEDILIREGSLQVIEKNIQNKIADLQDLQEKLKVILAQYEKKEDEKIKSLVKVYENMKPIDAAKIFEQLQIDILLEVAHHMKEAKLALVLSKMESIKAKELTEELANRRKIIGID